MLPKTLLVGCGRKQVKNLDEQYTAIDISKDYIEESKKIKPENVYIEANVMDMPFDEDYFDKVIFTEVLEHVDNPKKALSEIKRVMAPEGRLIMSVPVGKTDDFLGKHFKVYERDVIRGHHKWLFAKNVLEEYLKDFNNIKIVEKDKKSTAFWYLWGLVDKVLFKDLKIEESGRICSEKYPKLSKFVSRIILVLAIFGQVFVKKDYYKTYYIEAVK